MMRKFIRIMVMALLLVMACAASSCKKDSPDNLDITGEWKLESTDEFGDNIIVKSGETIEIAVYLSYSPDGSFEIFQKLGEGRYRRYSGTYSLTDGILTGKYSGGSAWANDYSIVLENNNVMTMIAVGAKFVSTYQRTSIPAEVRNSSIDVKSTSDNSGVPFLL